MVDQVHILQNSCNKYIDQIGDKLSYMNQIFSVQMSFEEIQNHNLFNGPLEDFSWSFWAHNWEYWYEQSQDSYKSYHKQSNHKYLQKYFSLLSVLFNAIIENPQSFDHIIHNFSDNN